MNDTGFLNIFVIIDDNSNAIILDVNHQVYPGVHSTHLKGYMCDFLSLCFHGKPHTEEVATHMENMISKLLLNIVMVWII